MKINKRRTYKLEESEEHDMIIITAQKMLRNINSFSEIIMETKRIIYKMGMS